MKNHEKILSVLLALILAFGSVAITPLSVSAAEAETAPTASMIDEAYPEYEYNVLDDGTAEIIKYTGKGGDVEIPSTLGGYTVTSIGERAFYVRKGLTSVTIPNSVTSFGEYAFSECTGLTSITIPDSVTSIGRSAFEDCTGLMNVNISNSLTSIGAVAFSGCTGLTDVIIPNSVTSIDFAAFSDCTGLKNVSISDSVTSINSYAFANCTGLSNITIGNSVTYIGYMAFSGCTGLTNVTIPDSVTNVGQNAFYNTAWYDNQPDGLVYAGKVAYVMKGDCPAEVIIKDGTLGIADLVFKDYTSLMSVTFPDSVTAIGNSAFYGCKGLTSIDIPDSVTSIGSSAFEGCKGLTSIVIPDSVTNIRYEAFFDCSGLTSVTIGNSVTEIGDEAFGYYSLETEWENVWEIKKVDDFTIYGYKGSEAERYADDNGFTFVPLRPATPDEATPDEATPDEATPDESTPDETKRFELTNTADGVRMEWDTHEAALYYTIYYRGPLGWVKLYSTIFNYHTDRDVSSGLTYTYKVCAYDEPDHCCFDYAPDGKSIKFIQPYDEATPDEATPDEATSDEATPDEATPDEAILGDVDGDGVVTVTDATFIQRKIANIEIPFEISDAVADVDRDGQVTLMDATYIQRWLIKLISGDNIDKPISGFDPNSIIITVSGEDFCYYDQTQYDYPYGDDTIALSGCAPTCFAMVASNIKKKSITPVDAVAWCGNDYYFCGVGTMWSYFEAAGAHFGIGFEGQTYDIDEAVAALKKGKYVISSHGPGRFTKGGTFIVMAGVDANDNIIVCDPNGDNHFVGTPFTAAEINESATSFWIFGNGIK